MLALSLGQRHSFALFLQPITSDLGWGRETFAFAAALQNLIWGIAQPFTGMVADRFGSLRVLIAGTVAYTLGLVLIPLSTTGVSFSLSAGLLVGLGLSGTAFGIVYGAIGRLVPAQQRSSALGIAGALGSLGQFFLLPVNQYLLSSFGWAAALVIAAFLVAFMAPFSIPLSERPSACAASPGQHVSLSQAISQAFGHSGFLLLGTGFFVCGFQLAFIGTHLPVFLLDRGLTPKVGMASLAIIVLANAIGTYLFGVLGDIYRKKYLLTAIYVVRSIAVALFLALPITPLSAYLFCAVIGLLWLGTVPLTTGIVYQVFGVRYLSTLFGFVFFVHQLGSFLGVWLGGYLFDRTGGYDLIWTLCIVLGVVAAVLHTPIKDAAIGSPGPIPART